MSARGTKRRSARQVADRKQSRSIYYEPETDEDERSDGDGDFALETEPSPKRRKTKPPTPAPARSRRDTRKPRQAKSKARETKQQPPRRKLGAPLKPKTKRDTVYAGPSDNKTPDWTGLPIEILRDVFLFASQSIQEQAAIGSSKVTWLMRAAHTCRAFAIPALEAYYQSPNPSNTLQPHHLLELLQIPKDKTYIDYRVKIKSLEVDVNRIAYVATGRERFDLSSLVRLLPQLQDLQITRSSDSPPYRKSRIGKWTYPQDLVQALDESGARLKTWRWTGDLIPGAETDGHDPYVFMTVAHTSKAFDRLERLVLCGFHGYLSSSTLPEQTENAEEDENRLQESRFAMAISQLPHVKDLSFVSCDLVMGKFFERIPKNLEKLELSNCLELTSAMLTAYLITGGSQLRELTLNHNSALDLTFLIQLKAFCPRLEVLTMDLTYYSEKINYNDAWAMYDHLLAEDDIPTWSSTLRVLELVNLQKWEAKAAQNLFRSLVDDAKDLPDLRHLVIQAHINIPWRDRVQFRDQWIERLNTVYLRRSEEPNPYMGSLRQYRLYKEATANGHAVASTVDLESDEEPSTRRRLSHVRVTPRKAPADVEAFADADPTPEMPHRAARRSTRVATRVESLNASTAGDDDSSSEDDGKPEDESKESGVYVQGLCPIVDIRIDNQRPAENQFTADNFLDSEPSGDEDWRSDAEDADDGNPENHSEMFRKAVQKKSGFRSWSMFVAEFQELKSRSRGSGPEARSMKTVSVWRCLRDSATARKLHTPSKSPSILRAPQRPSFQGPQCLSDQGRLDAIRRPLSTADHGEHTIYALSTAPGRAAIAIIRISGEACLSIHRALCPGKGLPKPRYATLRTLYEPGATASAESILDSNALVLYFPAPRTVTGEDVLELHVHGGPAVVKAVLGAISRCSGIAGGSRKVRYAEPGEFTRRAFMNDRLDLTQVEALGDVLSATTEQQRRLSVRGTTNALARRYEEWRQQLLYARGELEALIDFSEDQHFDESPTELCASVARQVEVLRRLIQAHSRNAVRGEMLRNGIAIALLGAPNAGKSSLLNCVVGREAAIVSHEAGTTRDVVEVGIDLGGYFCRLGDTAGLRNAKHAASQSLQMQQVIGQIEEEGMRRAKERAAESDVVVVVLSFESIDGKFQLHLDPEVMSTAATLVQEKDNVVVVINKQDTSPDHSVREAAVYTTTEALPGISRDRIHLISCKDADTSNANTNVRTEDAGHMQSFLHGLIRHFGAMTAAVTPDLAGGANDADPSIWQDSLGASERHRLLLDQCVGNLEMFLAEVQPNATSIEVPGADAQEPDIVVAAEHLRAAAECLAKITGRGEAGDVEEVLGVVFEKFCVGK